MNGSDGRQVLDVKLPSGAVVGVQLSGVTGDPMTSVGLLDNLDVRDALKSVAEIASLVRSQLDSAMPTKASVEFGLGFGIRAGKLASMLVDGKGEASLKVILEWEADRDARSSDHA